MAILNALKNLPVCILVSVWISISQYKFIISIYITKYESEVTFFFFGYDTFCFDFKCLLPAFSFLFLLDVHFYRYMFFVSFSLSFVEFFSFLQFPSFLLPSLIVQCFYRLQPFPVLTVVAFNLWGFRKTCPYHFLLIANHSAVFSISYSLFFLYLILY